MQLLFQNRIGMRFPEGIVKPVQNKPKIESSPVLVGDRPGDASGASIYGSVLHDGGNYRMWYQAWPKEWRGSDTSAVGYAESDDGVTWRKPELGMIELSGSKRNNLCELGLHSPSVMIDPHSPPEKRYRAVGYGGKGRIGGHPQVEKAGFYSAYSSDGFAWNLDKGEPTWDTNDVVTSVYHPGQARGLVALKKTYHVQNMKRRCICEATLENGVWSRERSILIPDEFDDELARRRGYENGDYYGMGLLPAGQATVGFVWMFRRHNLMDGEVDVSLAYQLDRDGKWIHQYGREDFIHHKDIPWAGGGIYTASAPIEVGDEHWLYITGTRRSHGWYTRIQADGSREVDEELLEEVDGEGMASIGIVKWPKWQLFGMRSDRDGIFYLDGKSPERESEMVLNFDCDPDGCIEAEVLGEDGKLSRHGDEQCMSMTGLSTRSTLRWKDGTPVSFPRGQNIRVIFTLKRATLYAFDWETPG